MNFNNLFSLECPYRPSSKCISEAAVAAIGQIGAAAISSAASYGTAQAGSKWTYNQMRTQHEYELENMRRQQDFQREMYERSLKDLSPAEQRRMIEEGGYNPYLYGDVSGNQAQGQLGASAAPSTSVSPHDSPYRDLGAAAQQGMETLARVMNMNADTEQKDLQNKDLSIRLEYARQQTEMGLRQVQASIEESLSRRDLSNQQRENLEAQKQQVELDLAFNRQTFNDRANQFGLMNKQIQAQTSYIDAQRTTEEILRNERLRNLIASTGNLKAQSASLMQGIAESCQRIALMGSQIDLNSKQGQLVVAQEAKTLAEKLGVDNNNKNYPLFLRKLESEIFNNTASGIQSLRQHTVLGDVLNPFADIEDVYNDIYPSKQKKP